MKKQAPKSKQLLFAVFGSFAMLFSCSNIDEIDSTDEVLSVDEIYDAKSTLKRKFGQSLMASLNESKSLRDLIKNESLKMFDNDYEVLYQMIKDERLENGITVRQLILKNLGDENLLNEIEINNPTLTILVPELPEDSFSAKLWDTQNQIPKVAVRVLTSNDVPIINLDGSEEILPSKYIPSFPVIVIKDNERIIASGSNEFKKLKTKVINKSKDIEFKFLDDCFDRTKTTSGDLKRIVTGNLLDQKIKNAYNIYSTAEGWDRDYIYYDITPSSPDGSFKYDFQEGLTSFILLGDPMAAYNTIADQTGDPTIKLTTSNPQSGWTGGNFEFKVRVIYNSTNGAGSEIIKYFTAIPSDLFVLNYVRPNPFSNYTLSSVVLKTKFLNIPIFNWDLDQYATTIKIDIEEIDLTETTVLTDTRVVEFATNFSIDPTAGFLKKIGLKFGASLKETETHSVQRTFTEGNDELGEVIVNFADDIIVNQYGSLYYTRQYSSGLYSISVEPVRVQ